MNTLDVSPTVTGLVVGAGPLCGIISAFLMGYVSDKFGRRKIMEFSLILWSLAFVGFAFSNTLWQFLICNMLYGASRSSFESVATALLSDVTVEENRKRVFHYRYFFINLAACGAPLIGLQLILKNPSLGFCITSVVYFLYYLALRYFMNRYHVQIQKDDSSVITFAGTMNVVRSDHALLLFLLGNIFMLLGFCQLETNVPQYLNQTFADYGIKLYSYFMIVNGATIVCFQLWINRMTKNMDLVKLTNAGFLICAAGMVVMGLFAQIPNAYLISMFIISIGEILVFSNSYILIDKLGPAHLKGSYFGAVEICHLGFVLGPSMGGFIMQRLGGPNMFIIMGLLSVISVFLFIAGDRFHKRKLALTAN
ncbi:MAG: MFS transporter [Proteobacteria bacterium]|nr:MFS transporter [Pseudomonadota bacterium]